MRIGLNGNHFMGGPPIDETIDHANSAAVDGLATYWMSQAPIATTDALTVLAVVGRQVDGIELGVAVVPVYQRHPLMLATQARTTATSVGRPISLGVGLSHRAPMQLLGVDDDRPVGYMREYLDILVPAVTTGEIDHRGPRLMASADIGPPDEPLPVYLGALGPQMLRLAGSRTDGACVAWAGPRSLRNQITPALRQGADEAERATPRLVVTIPVCVTSDVTAARARAEHAFAGRGEMPSYRYMADLEGVETPAGVSIIGTEAEVDERLDDLADAGATDLSVTEFDWTPDERDRTRALMARRAVRQ